MKGKYVRHILSIIMVLALLSSFTFNVYAESLEYNNVDNGVAEFFDSDRNEYVRMRIIEKSSKSQAALNVFQVYINDQLDHTASVDLEQDKATTRYSDGRIEEIIISEHVTVTKTADITTPILEETPIQTYAARANYIDSEPFEISASGAQLSLGTAVYSGYETMGRMDFFNPIESAYLQRKNAGYTTYDSYKFTISEGTSIGAAIGIIVGISSIASSIVGALLGALVGSTIDTLLKGELRCREYGWDYRVRHNSNTGTILKTASRYRSWYEMFDARGNRSFEYKGAEHGWLLSNHELIYTALGR